VIAFLLLSPCGIHTDIRIGERTAWVSCERTGVLGFLAMGGYGLVSCERTAWVSCERTGMLAMGGYGLVSCVGCFLGWAVLGCDVGWVKECGMRGILNSNP